MNYIQLLTEPGSSSLKPYSTSFESPSQKQDPLTNSASIGLLMGKSCLNHIAHKYIFINLHSQLLSPPGNIIYFNCGKTERVFEKK